MRQVISISFALAALVLFGDPLLAGSGDFDAIQKARKLIANQELQAATLVLEEALPNAESNQRVTILDLLKTSYETLLREAEAAGKKREAETYRDNLAILKSVHATPEQPEPPQSKPLPTVPRTPEVEQERKVGVGIDNQVQTVPRSADRAPENSLVEPAKLPEPDPLPLLETPISAAATPDRSATRNPAPDFQRKTGRLVEIPNQPPDQAKPRNETAPATDTSSPRPEAQAKAPAPGLAEADGLFAAKRYEEAGRIYALLAGQNRLPKQRKDVWAYCRWVAVVKKINAPPRSAQQWDEIEKEILSIQRLTPGNWYGEYLRSRVAEARRGGGASTPGRSKGLVVRGSAPEEPPPRRLPRLFGRARSEAPKASPKTPDDSLELPSPAPEPEASDSPVQPERKQDVPTENAGTVRALVPPRDNVEKTRQAAQANETSPPKFSWQVLETDNFRIFHADPALAEKAAEAAEAVRTSQSKRWGSPATRGAWSPRCELYLYPSPAAFARMTGQPETSPGFSTMGISGNRITARRVNLRADHPLLLTAILPHEVTHVVLADLFTKQQIPRWADEGLAVLAEPLPEQMNRAAELTGPLAEGRIFKLRDLMAIDYPNENDWGLYYAQSVSLTRFLVEQGAPSQFIAFVQEAQRTGIEKALQEVYQIDGFGALEERWRDFARREVEAVAATTRDDKPQTNPTRRQ